MKQIDTRGALCPAPLIMTKRAIKGAVVGDMFEILSDNEVAVINLLSYLRELNIENVREQRDGIEVIRFVIGGGIASVEDSRPEDFCTIPSKRGQYVVVLKSRLMGDGDEELGELLMRSCLNSMIELDVLPKAIIMYNEGVRLAIDNTDSCIALKELEDAGVEVIICGTCVDYYNLKGQIKIGAISNMYKINTIVGEASHVVYP